MSDWKIVDGGSTFDFETDLHFKVQQAPGTGMPPVTNVRSEYGLLDGALYQRTRADTRQFSLIGTLKGDTTADLHSRRRALVDRVKMDRSASQQPTVIQYLGSGSTLQASGFYTGGLEFGDVEHNIEANVGLGFEMLDPYWEAQTAGSQSLTSGEVFEACHIVQRNTSGSWTNMDGGMNASVLALEYDGGIWYAGGAFTTAGSNAAQYVAQYDGNEWTCLGASNALDGLVHDMAFDANGDLVVVGAFLNVSGSSQFGNAKWSPSASAWSKIGAGCAIGTTLTVAIGNDNTYYLGGQFTTAAGSTVNRVVQFYGGSWFAMGTGMNDQVNSLRYANGKVYAGGDFASAGGIDVGNLAQWSVSGSAWSAIGASGADDVVSVVDVGLDGTLYVGGKFDNLDSVAAQSIGSWNGLQFTSMNTGIYSDIESMSVAPNGDLYVGSNDDSDLGGVSMNGYTGVWKGGTWHPTGVQLAPLVEYVYDILADETGALTIGYSYSGANPGTSMPGTTTVTNEGTAKAYPIITASGPGRISHLLNYTTGKYIYFDLVLNSGEEVTLDLRPGRKTFVSDFRGNILRTVRPGSNLADWFLLPGDNNVVFMIDDSTASATIEFKKRYWSLDGSA